MAYNFIAKESCDIALVGQTSSSEFSSVYSSDTKYWGAENLNMM